MDLYAEHVMDHAKQPRYRGRLSDATITLEEINPSCGDTVTMDILVDEEGIIKEIGHQNGGCAISTAGISLMAEYARGKKLKEFLSLSPEVVYDLFGVKVSPGRVKCALLGYATLKHAAQNLNKE